MYPFIDLHEDLAGAPFHPKLIQQTDFDQLKDAHTKLIFGTGFTLPEENLLEVVDRDLTYYQRHCVSDPTWIIIKTREDVQQIMNEETRHGVLFHIEGLPGFAGDFKLLDTWYARGLRSVGLVWNDDNSLGGGTNSHNGLTKMGQEFIKHAEAKGIFIDLAHANQTMFQDCLSVLQRPPFISHTGLYSLVSNKRNNTDEQLIAIAKRGGIVGIFLYKDALARGDSYGIDDVVAHVKAAVDLIGEDAVAIGTDFGGMIDGVPKEIPTVSTIETLWDSLKEAGLTDRQIEKIASKNAFQYLIENLPNTSL